MPNGDCRRVKPGQWAIYHCRPAARTLRSPSAPARVWPTPANTSPGSTIAWPASSIATPSFLFELRGLPRERLNQALRSTPLGQTLVGLTDDQAEPIAPAESLPRPHTGEAPPDYHSCWTGRQRLPTEIEPATPAAVPAILVHKAGDFPAFWGHDRSFVEVME
jgi:hypothetical protein